MSKGKDNTKYTKCFPPDHDAILSQRDVYVVPKNADKLAYTLARQVRDIVTLEGSLLFISLSIHSFFSFSVSPILPLILFVLQKFVALKNRPRAFMPYYIALQCQSGVSVSIFSQLISHHDAFMDH